MDTRQRYRTYADRIAPVSPAYAAWARSVDDDLVALLDELPATQRQPELLFAVARRLGADPTDVASLRTLGREARPALVAALTTATVQANDPRRLAPVVPVLAALSAASDRPIGLLDVGAAAGLCSIPDRVTLDHRQPDGPAGAPGSLVRVHTAVAGPAVHLVADVTGTPPEPAASPIRIGARVALDPEPIDPAAPGALERLVEAVPPEATDRTALMAEALRATLVAPPVRIRGRVPEDLDRALDALPDDCEPVVLTTGTLVYVPGAGRQRLVDRLRERRVRWVALERTGILAGVAATLPADVEAADPDAFATLSLDGRALAVSDAFGTRVRWFGRALG
ncbi:DUF2332 family protein [Curtobacterium herbarum]|uniref:DUF2332 domain-containing protein n=1 Tax=Curtobacterium herbarum TaxID=150122 RepID=A0ABP4K8E0_9MICO|nr:DUF2332 family protein [Curtobacterium herbarum]MBM7474236.1 hypothetical protein [Curtobacterium herbarum]MCS6546058.1 DUF2332 domain-containing protein [Curtobacterium herbarum]